MEQHLKPIRILWRLSLLIVHIFLGLILIVPFINKSIRPDSFSATLALWWHGRLCKIFGVRVTASGEVSQTPTLFVVNHISWFDIPALGSKVPVHFLSKDEINSWPVIGWMAERMGTLFIRRGHRGAAEQSIKEIASVLKKGNHVIIFPEGTTTDGTSVKRFHSRLYQAAIDASAQVQPVALGYPHPEGVHPKAPFVGETQFLDSSLSMISEATMDVSLIFLDPLNPADYTRDELASISQQNILKVIESIH